VTPVYSQPAYRLEVEKYYEDQEFTSYKVENETRFEDRIITRNVPRSETIRQTQSYEVRKPITETKVVDETYTVLEPVTRTEYVDQSYYETQYVTETSERAETYTTYRPVVETEYQTQNVVVQKPVTDTYYQNQQYMTYKPVDTTSTATVDNGSYYAQQYYQPGNTRYRPRIVGGGYTTDPRTGQSVWRRGGLGFAPITAQGNAYTALQYQPNYQQVAIPQTTYVPEVVQQSTPFQVQRMESEVVQQQVPVQVQKMQAVQEQRMVPYSVEKPVQRYVEKKVPVTRTEYVPVEHVRQVRLQRQRIVTETATREVPITRNWVDTIEETVRVPVKYSRVVKVPEIRQVMKTRVVRKPIAYVDPFLSNINGVTTTSGYSPSMSYSSSAPVADGVWKKVGEGPAVRVDDSLPAETTTAKKPAGENQEAIQQTVKKPETADPNVEESETSTTAAPDSSASDAPEATLQIGGSDGSNSAGDEFGDVQSDLGKPSELRTARPLTNGDLQ
jgi:hypothetical protein